MKILASMSSVDSPTNRFFQQSGTVLLLFIMSLLLSACALEASQHSEDGASIPATTPDELVTKFADPPMDTWPGVYWYFMDGNQSRTEMVKDLEAMARVGIGAVIFLEVNIGIPRGPVDFMSDEWRENFAFAVETAEELGIRVILGTGPGWAGSGGPWVEPSWSMQHLTGGVAEVNGPAQVDLELGLPLLEPNTFSGMSEALMGERETWYRDVAVLAFPSLPDAEVLPQFELKALKETKPYSIWKDVPRFIPMSASTQDQISTSTISSNEIIDLTDHLDSEGRLVWDAPEGDWTIIRFIARSTGQTTRPAPLPGHGFETDKFTIGAFRRHWENYQGRLLQQINVGESAGLTQIHLDSWEMSSQNWSATFREEFTARRGYDPQPYYPAYLGMIVDSRDTTERFLWDMRKTAQELVLENYAGEIRDTAHAHGMLYSNQPYDMNPAGNIDLGAVADIPSCEFWDDRNNDIVDTLYSCLEASSIANTMGRSVLQAEAFTSVAPLRFHAYPAQMKNQTDWALAMGVTQFVFHTFQHQPLGDDFVPGMSMGPFGVNWHRNQTWWEMLGPYHEYIARASLLLRQGRTVADILYLTPEGVPHIFLPPNDALSGEGVIRDKRGYSFDAVSPKLLREYARVEDGRIVFENGASYFILILPDVDTMTPETLEFIADLVEKGAIVVGNAPSASPSLENFPAGDQTLKTIARGLWGEGIDPNQIGVRSHGAGRVYYGRNRYLDASENALYPLYRDTVEILRAEGVRPDLVSSTGMLRFSHKQTDRYDIYFVSNSTDKPSETSVLFRAQSVQPSLWHPLTGKVRVLPDYKIVDDAVSVPLRFEAYESFFIVFDNDAPASQLIEPQTNFPATRKLTDLTGDWRVHFDPARGGPGEIVLSNLTDWSRHDDEGVKYYSGVATYSREFEINLNKISETEQVYLDLGSLSDVARVSLNGLDVGIVWTAPWRVPLGEALRDGNNKLVIEVANSWENRLIGDRQSVDTRHELVWENGLLGGVLQPAGEHTFTTYVDEAADFGEIDIGERALQRSGLFGPVRVVVEEFEPQEMRD